jgi:rRNA-processing protein FCF1
MHNTNPYHDRVRSFAKGNITEENERGNNRYVRIRLPEYVYQELKALAEAKRIPTGRFTIELLRSLADRQIQKRKADEANLAELE